MNQRTPTLALLLGATGLLPVLVGCAQSKWPSVTVPRERFQPTDAELEAADERAAANASAQRGRWREKSFDAFEKSVYKEPFAGGKYIVNGDSPIADRKHLEEFFQDNIQRGKTSELILHVEGGQDALWDCTQKEQLTYCVSMAFGNRYAGVVQEMESATGAWEDSAEIDFIHVATQDDNCNASNSNVVFDVRPVNVNGAYLARAFFPNEPRASRNILIDDSSFGLPPTEKLQLVGILRHELGHTLGFRHEHTRPEAGTCFEDSDWRPLTNYDAFSVMHYPQCNGGGDWELKLTTMDENGAACVYGPAPAFELSSPPVCDLMNRCVDSGCRVQRHFHGNQQVQRRLEKDYGPFDVSPGTVFRAEMVGGSVNPGDPDLYVRFGHAPNRTGRLFDCRPYLSGADETCSLDVPAGETKAFVMVHGYRRGSYDLTIDFTGE